MGECYKCNFATSAALAVVYFLFPSQWTKILPVLFNAVHVDHDAYGTLIGYGLAFSALGDIALEISSTDAMYFMAGLAAFLVAHLFYIKAFWVGCMDFHFSAVAFNLAYYVAIMNKLLPHIVQNEPELKVPVIVYGVVICLMGATAITRAHSYHLGISHKSKLFAALGAIMFVVSDTILATDKFVTPPIAHAKWYVMVTYYIAQTFIAASAWPTVAQTCPNGCNCGGSGTCTGFCPCCAGDRCTMNTECKVGCK